MDSGGGEMRSQMQSVKSQVNRSQTDHFAELSFNEMTRATFRSCGDKVEQEVEIKTRASCCGCRCASVCSSGVYESSDVTVVN